MVAVLLCGAATAATTHVRAQRCLIAFTRNDTSLTDVAVYDTASGRVRDVTYGEGEDMTPAWSPDGTRLAFARANSSTGADANAHIWVTDLAWNARQLTFARADDFDPAWSPDGRRIVFSRHGALDVVDVRTRRVARLTTIPQTTTFASWSPDGRTIAYDTQQGIVTLDLRTHRKTLAVPNATNAQYLPSGVLAYRLGDTFHAGGRALTISFAGRGDWNASVTGLVFASFVDENLTAPPAPGLYVARVGAPRPRHLYVSHFAGSPSWRPGCG